MFDFLLSVAFIWAIFYFWSSNRKAPSANSDIAASHSESIRSGLSADAAYMVVLDCARSMGLPIERVDPSRKEVTLGTNANTLHNGYWVCITVRQAVGGGSYCEVKIASKTIQLAGLGTHLNRAVGAVRAALYVAEAANPPPEPVSLPVPGGVADKLDKLASLRAQGLLTDSEFEIAKRRLLATQNV